jgi:hypothetical protein
MRLSNKRRKPRQLRHVGMQEFILFEPPLSPLKKTSDLRDCAPTALRAMRAHRRAASSIAVGFERPTTPCRFCSSITAKWSIRKRRSRTGRSAPNIRSPEPALKDVSRDVPVLRPVVDGESHRGSARRKEVPYHQGFTPFDSGEKKGSSRAPQALRNRRC